MADNLQPTTDEYMTLREVEEIYQTNSVDKADYWKAGVDGSIRTTILQDSAVYNGGFLSQFVNRTGQAFAGIFTGIPGGATALLGAQVKKRGFVGIGLDLTKAATITTLPGISDILNLTGVDDRIERFIGEKTSGTYEAYLERSEVMGEKMVNFGLYMADVGNEIIAEMERSQPTTNPLAKFLGDATGSILATVGLFYAGGGGLAIGVFGVSSGLDVSTEALQVGRDADTALAAGILTGAAVSGLEMIGLKAIFGRTAKSGIIAASKHILLGLTTEGITEGLQEVVELGGSYAVGGYARDITVLDALSQMAYASAVGAVAGGAMVSGVTVAQRVQAVNIMQRTFGLDRTTANNIVKKAEQAAMEDIMNTVGGDTGYDTIQNRKYQNMRDIVALARGEVGIDNASAKRIFESLKIRTPGEQLLDQIRAQVTADVNAEIEEGTITGQTVKGKAEIDAASEIIADIARREVVEPDQFEAVEPEIINNIEPIYREIFMGRVRELSRVAKDVKRQLLTALRLQGARGGSINVQSIQRMVQTYIDATSELTYLKQNPTDIVFTGDNVIQLKNAEVLARIADNQTVLILRNVKRNFKLGKRATTAEVAYVKAVIKQLLNRPGISQTQKFEQLGRWMNTIRTPQQLEKRFIELEMKVDDILQANLIAAYQKSIDNMIVIMKGRGTGAKRRVKLGARSQKLADIFLRALKQKDIDPFETAEKIHTAEGLMRTLAARLVTGVNPDGSQLTPRDYMNIENTLRNFITRESLGAERQKQIQKKTIERQRERVVSDLKQTQGLAKTGPREFWEKTIDQISRRFNYDALIASLAKGMGTQMGSSVFESITDFNKSFIKNETLYTYFTTQFNEGAKRIFKIGSTLELSKKFLRDNINDTDIIIMTGDSAETLGGFWSGSVAQAREKYMLWLSPEGQEIMKIRGWTEGTIEDLTNQLSKEDTDFIALQLDIYNEIYTPVNETFKNINGYDLSYRERYSPVYRDGIEFETVNMIDQLLGRAPVKGSDLQNANFLKELTMSEKKLKNVADFQKMRYYIKDASYYAAMAEQVKQVQEVVTKEDVREQIISMRDKDFYGRLEKYINILAQGKRYGAGANLNSAMNNAVTNMQKMLLAGKAILFPKQMVSALAAIEVVSPQNFAKYISQLPAALKSGELSELLEHPYFAHRSIRRAISRDIFDINAAFESGQMSKKGLKKAEIDLTLNHYLFLATQLGDMGGTILNGWAVYKHYQEVEGLSKAEAANKAVAHIDRTQQSARPTQQIGMSLDPNPMSRAFTSFTHAPMQYASILVQQLDTIGTDRFSATKFARTFAIFFTILPMLYQAVGRAFNYRKEDTPQYLAEFALGPFDQIPLTGGLLRVLVARATYNVYKNTIDEEVKLPYSARWSSAASGLFESMFKNIADVERALSKEYEDGISLSDFLHITTQLAEATGPIGGLYSGLGRAISGGAEGIALMAEESGDGTTVNSVRRLLMLLGYSEYATRPTEE